jgi:hypothetical protein
VNRRNFALMLASVPFLGWLAPKPKQQPYTTFVLLEPNTNIWCPLTLTKIAPPVVPVIGVLPLQSSLDARASLSDELKKDAEMYTPYSCEGFALAIEFCIKNPRYQMTTCVTMPAGIKPDFNRWELNTITEPEYTQLANGRGRLTEDDWRGWASMHRLETEEEVRARQAAEKHTILDDLCWPQVSNTIGITI